MSNLQTRVKSLERLAGLDTTSIVAVIQEDQLDKLQWPREVASVVVDPRTGRRVRPVYILSDFPEEAPE